jgi:uncharacterized protein
MTTFLDSGPETARQRLLLAHGAGAGFNSLFLEAFALEVANRGIAVTRFEFAYMAARRSGGSKRPPPKAEALVDEYRAALGEIRAAAPRDQSILIAGKSLGGRVASLIADETYAAGLAAGVVCLGYPFHPPNLPAKLRTAHLEQLDCPALIVQGERDPFGNRQEVERLTLSPQIKFAWISDGDHDFGPRGASGFTRKGNLAHAADVVAAFALDLNPRRDV